MVIAQGFSGFRSRHCCFSMTSQEKPNASNRLYSTSSHLLTPHRLFPLHSTRQPHPVRISYHNLTQMRLSYSHDSLRPPYRSWLFVESTDPPILRLRRELPTLTLPTISQPRLGHHDYFHSKLFLASLHARVLMCIWSYDYELDLTYTIPPVSRFTLSPKPESTLELRAISRGSTKCCEPASFDNIPIIIGLALMETFMVDPLSSKA